MTAVEDLWMLANGYRVSEALYVGVLLGVSDQMAGQPREVDWLAERTGSDAGSLYRLMRALATLGVYEELPDRRFGPTPRSEALRRDAPDSVAPWIEQTCSPSHRAAWGGLLDSVRTGDNAFRAVHGMSAWDYRAAHPEANAVFDAAMTSISRTAAHGVLGVYDFGGFATIADIGGGRGALLGAILARYPGARGVLGDQAHVIAGAPDLLTGLGVLDRCEIVPVDFFASVPSGADAYLLKSIIHDWEDPEAIEILRNVRSAMTQAAVLLVVERVIGAPQDGMLPAFSDLNMLVGPGGRERTEAEFDEIFAAAGLRRTRSVPTPSGFNVIEAVVSEALVDAGGEALVS